MIAIIAIMFFVMYLTFFFPMEERPKKKEIESPKHSAQMKKLWQIAQTSMKERKPFRAEKALLTILKFDEKNAAAYNRLGILYAKDQKYDEAVECFEIAQSLDNNPASIHNAGLIYYETGAYEKAEIAFQQAIDLEGDVPARYIALAKAEEKLGKRKKAIEALENAYELDPKVTTLRQMLSIYEDMDDAEGATAMSARIEAQIARENEAKRKKATSRALKAIRATNGGKMTVKATRERINRSRVRAKTATAKTAKLTRSARTATKSRSVINGSTTAKRKSIMTSRRQTRQAANPQVIKPHAGRKRI